MPISLSYQSDLADCRRLFLADYLVMVKIGVHDYEKQCEQRVILNVDVYVPFACTTPQHDLLAEVVDYDVMRQVIERYVRRGHVHLQETLCDQIADSLLAHPGVRAVRVSSSKPDAYSNCAGVGVEVFRISSAGQVGVA
jgi:dihydroneopterin aldolase